VFRRQVSYHAQVNTKPEASANKTEIK
jgi:hypothetical protein